MLTGYWQDLIGYSAIKTRLSGKYQWQGIFSHQSENSHLPEEHKIKLDFSKSGESFQWDSNLSE